MGSAEETPQGPSPLHPGRVEDPTAQAGGLGAEGEHCERARSKAAAARSRFKAVGQLKHSHKLDFETARKAGEQEVKVLL